MDTRSKTRRRLDRIYDRIGRRVPWARGFINWIQRPRMIIVRLPLGILLIVGGLLSFLPILGIWMLPLGLMFLAIDFPPLQGPVAATIIRLWRWWDLRRMRRERTQAAR
ncbi:MAG TPA: hypothetical protein VHB23_08865 [Devosiaceae bacterium]|jgi:hypothetical protein|nr:hypothetical protein [Devosiaceae bacterium]